MQFTPTPLTSTRQLLLLLLLLTLALLARIDLSVGVRAQSRTQFGVPISTGHSTQPRRDPSSAVLSFPSATDPDLASVLCLGVVDNNPAGGTQKDGVVLSTDGGLTWKDAAANITGIGPSGFQSHVQPSSTSTSTSTSSSSSVHGSIYGIGGGYVKPWNNTKDMVGPWKATRRYTYAVNPSNGNVYVVDSTNTTTAPTPAPAAPTPAAAAPAAPAIWAPLPHKSALQAWTSGGVAHLGGDSYVATPWVWYNDVPFYTKEGKMNISCCNGSVVAYITTDGGARWNYAGEIASKQSLNAAGFHSEEGPNENDVVLLADGKTVLCIIRRDGGDGKLHHAHVPYLFATATLGEGGLLPSAPPVPWKLSNAPDTMLSARPRALVLGNGALVVAGGRPALNIWISAGGSVEGPWETVDIPTVHNSKVRDSADRFCNAFENATDALGWYQSSCYTELVALARDTGLVCYEKQGATSGGGKPVPPECAYSGSSVYCMRFTVTV